MSNKERFESVRNIWFKEWERFSIVKEYYASGWPQEHDVIIRKSQNWRINIEIEDVMGNTFINDIPSNLTELNRVLRIYSLSATTDTIFEETYSYSEILNKETEIDNRKNLSTLQQTVRIDSELDSLNLEALLTVIKNKIAAWEPINAYADKLQQLWKRLVENPNLIKQTVDSLGADYTLNNVINRYFVSNSSAITFYPDFYKQVSTSEKYKKCSETEKKYIAWKMTISKISWISENQVDRIYKSVYPTDKKYYENVVNSKIFKEVAHDFSRQVDEYATKWAEALWISKNDFMKDWLVWSLFNVIDSGKMSGWEKDIAKIVSIAALGIAAIWGAIKFTKSYGIVGWWALIGSHFVTAHVYWHWTFEMIYAGLFGWWDKIAKDIKKVHWNWSSSSSTSAPAEQPKTDPAPEQPNPKLPETDAPLLMVNSPKWSDELKSLLDQYKGDKSREEWILEPAMVMFLFWQDAKIKDIKSYLKSTSSGLDFDLENFLKKNKDTEVWNFLEWMIKSSGEKEVKRLILSWFNKLNINHTNLDKIDWDLTLLSFLTNINTNAPRTVVASWQAETSWSYGMSAIVAAINPISTAEAATIPVASTSSTVTTGTGNKPAKVESAPKLDGLDWSKIDYSHLRDSSAHYVLEWGKVYLFGRDWMKEIVEPDVLVNRNVAEQFRANNEKLFIVWWIANIMADFYRKCAHDPRRWITWRFIHDIDYDKKAENITKLSTELAKDPLKYDENKVKELLTEMFGDEAHNSEKIKEHIFQIMNSGKSYVEKKIEIISILREKYRAYFLDVSISWLMNGNMEEDILEDWRMSKVKELMNDEWFIDELYQSRKSDLEDKTKWTYLAIKEKIKSLWITDESMQEDLIDKMIKKVNDLRNAIDKHVKDKESEIVKTVEKEPGLKAQIARVKWISESALRKSHIVDWFKEEQLKISLSLAVRPMMINYFTDGKEEFKTNDPKDKYINLYKDASKDADTEFYVQLWFDIAISLIPMWVAATWARLVYRASRLWNATNWFTKWLRGTLSTVAEWVTFYETNQLLHNGLYNQKWNEWLADYKEISKSIIFMWAFKIVQELFATKLITKIPSDKFRKVLEMTAQTAGISYASMKFDNIVFDDDREWSPFEVAQVATMVILLHWANKLVWDGPLKATKWKDWLIRFVNPLLTDNFVSIFEHWVFSKQFITRSIKFILWWDWRAWWFGWSGLPADASKLIRTLKFTEHQLFWWLIGWPNMALQFLNVVDKNEDQIKDYIGYWIVTRYLWLLYFIDDMMENPDAVNRVTKSFWGMTWLQIPKMKGSPDGLNDFLKEYTRELWSQIGEDNVKVMMEAAVKLPWLGNRLKNEIKDRLSKRK